MAERPKLGFDDLEPNEFTPKAAGFRSREPQSASPRQVGRKKTGRTVQLNLKATQEKVDEFLAIADRNGWSQAVTFEKLVDTFNKKDS